MSHSTSTLGTSPFGPLPYGPRMQRLLPPLYRAFGDVNRYAIVPLFRAGLGSLFFSSPFAHVMVLRTTGRKSGRPRYAPLGYAILDGAVYCTAGFGPRTHWLLNIRENPAVEVLLPGGAAYAGVAEEVTDPDEWLRSFREVMIGCGVVGGLSIGENPWRVTDEALLAKGRGLPVVRVRPTGVAAGPADPGGGLWVVLTVISVAWLLGWLRGRTHGRGGAA